MDSPALNEAIREICDRGDEFPVRGLGGEKAIAYYGWYWRDVNFDVPRLRFGDARQSRGFDVPGWIGFMESNKWGYGAAVADEDLSALIREALEDACSSPSSESCQKVFDLMQEAGV